MSGPTDRVKWQVETRKGAGAVPWRPGYYLPPSFTAKIKRDDLPFTIEVEIEVADRNASCRSIRFIADDSSNPISARALRRVPVQDFIDTAVSTAAMPGKETAKGLVIRQGGTGEVTEQFESPKQSRRRPTDEQLQEVARIYEAAQEAGDPPIRAVEREHSEKLTYASAAKWAARARERGFLEPVKRKTTKRDKET